MIMLAFLFAQSLSFAHAHEHDHSHESPIDHRCEICIVAVTDDGDASIFVDQRSDAEDILSFWIELNRLALPKAAPTPSVENAEPSIDPPPDLIEQRLSARAPPL